MPDQANFAHCGVVLPVHNMNLSNSFEFDNLTQSEAGTDKVLERAASLPGNDKENRGNKHINVIAI